MSTTTELLERFRPFLQYDSQESYFADSAAEWTDNPGNQLKRADGTVLAAAGQGLELSFLGPHYAQNASAAKADVISNPSRKYREQARRLHALPGYANHVYGHAVMDAAGAFWLQYWFWYFYNDYNLIGSFLHAGLHEGDWEMIQLRLRADETPDHAIYCQHAGATSRAWNKVRKLAGTERPIVYVARGSHASYFEPGTQWTGHWFDHADGKRKSPESTLNIVTDDAKWRWVRWPGSWGDTKKAGSPLDSDSPRGPAAHAQWDDPLSLMAKAGEELAAPAERPSPPPPPTVRAEWANGRLRVLYEVSAAPGGQLPTGLAVTINSPNEKAPPTTEAFEISSPEGEVTLFTAVDPSKSYDVHTSAATADGLASESVRSDLSPLFPPAG